MQSSFTLFVCGEGFTIKNQVKHQQTRLGDKIGVLAPSLVVFSLIALLPGGLFRFTWIKLTVVLIALAFGLFAGKGWRVPRPIMWVVAAGALSIFAGIIVSGSAMPGLLGRWPRYEGILTMGIYVAVLAMGAKTLGGPRTGNAWQWLHRSMAGVSLVLASISILESTGLRPLGGAADLRPGATLGNATDQGLAAVLIVGALSLPALASRDGWRWFLRAGLLASGLTVVLSGSRAALLGLLVVIVTVSALSLSQKGNRAKLGGFIAAAALTAMALAVFLIPASRDRLFSGATVSGRWLIWQQTLDMARDNLWLGVGTNRFVDELPRYQSAQWAVEVGNSFPPDSPHMVLLQALAIGGLPLLLLLIALTVLLAFYAVRSIKDAADPGHRANLVGAIAAVAAYGLGLLTHFTSPSTTPLALLLLGALLAIPPAGEPVPRIPKLSKGSTMPPPRARAGTFAAGAAVVLALLVALPATVAEWPMAAGAKAAAQGLPKEADRHFEQARSLRPWDGDTALLAAQAFAGPASDGDPTAAALAVKWAELSLKRTPASGEARLALAIGQINSGDYAAGKQTLDKLIAAAPNNADPYIQRGVAEFGLGNVDASIADLKMAVALSPKSPTAQQILDQVLLRTGRSGS